MTNTLGKGLGYYPYPDERDHPLKARIDRLEAPKSKGSKWWENSLRLDQDGWDACVGFAHVQAFNSAPTRHSLGNDYAIEVYKNATFIDEWPGDDWSTSGGTSVRAGAKEMQKRGHIPAYAFTRDIEELAVWVLSKGPVVIGVDWWSEMDNPIAADDYYVHVQGHKVGGHAIVVDGCRFNGDKKDYFRLLNSWSAEWGDGGRCKIKVQSLESLLNARGGTACTWVERELPR